MATRSVGPDISYSRAQREPEEVEDWPVGHHFLDGKYRVEAIINSPALGIEEGAQGKVYQVSDARSPKYRFAVKRMLDLKDEDARERFHAELRFWSDLPLHPHIVPFLFFRTEHGEVLLFSDYIDGGSLAQQIKECSLTRIEDILDIAIQIAWGLHVVHEMGLLHQDVKPANVLLTRDGTVKIGDLGTARIKHLAPQLAPHAPVSPYYTYRGLTPAYCSPEQWTIDEEMSRTNALSVRKLTRQTDMWSWAATVLAMFAGRVFWDYGHHVDAALNQYLELGSLGIGPMPDAVAEVLRRCLVREPGQRYATLLEAAQALIAAFPTCSEEGRPYHRAPPSFMKVAERGVVADDRRTVYAVEWDSTQEVLVRALRADGKSPAAAQAQAKRLLGEGAALPGTQAVRELHGYEEAKRIYGRLIEGDAARWGPELARLLTEHALLYRHLDDVSMALGEYERAIAILEDFINVQGRRELANDLAAAYMNKGNALQDSGDLPGALGEYGRAIAIYEELVDVQGRRELAKDLAMAYVNNGNALQHSGDHQGALGEYGRAIAILEDFGNVLGRRELADSLVFVYMNKANVLRASGDLPGALSEHGRAIAILEDLLNVQGRRELANELAMAYMNKAVALQDSGDLPGALSEHGRAIAILADLVNVQGRRELANELAMAYMNKAVALQDSGDLAGAIGEGGRAIAILEDLVNVQSRRELANELAAAHMNNAVALQDSGDLPRALGEYGRAIAIYEELVNVQGRRELAKDFVLTLRNKALGLKIAGDLAQSLQTLERALAVDANSAAAWGGKGDTLAAMDEHGRAVEAYVQAVKLDPQLASAWRSLGMILAADGQSEQAAICFERVFALDKADLQAALKLVEVYFAIERFDDALALCDRIIEAEPNSDHARRMRDVYSAIIPSGQ